MTLEELLDSLGAGALGPASYGAVKEDAQAAYGAAKQIDPQSVYDFLYDAAMVYPVGISEIAKNAMGGFSRAGARYADRPAPPAPGSVPQMGEPLLDIKDVLSRLQSEPPQPQRSSYMTANGRPVESFTVKGDAQYQPSRNSFSKVKMTFPGDREAQAELEAKKALAQIMTQGKLQSEAVSSALGALKGSADPELTLKALLTVLQKFGLK